MKELWLWDKQWIFSRHVFLRRKQTNKWLPPFFSVERKSPCFVLLICGGGNFKLALEISVEVSLTSCYANLPKNIKVYFSYEKIFEFLFTHRLFSCGRRENNVTGISEISFPDKSLSVNKITNKFESQHGILHFLITSCKKLIYAVVVKLFLINYNIIQTPINLYNEFLRIVQQNKFEDGSVSLPLTIFQAD